MWAIITQPLQKHYHTPILSRGFIISSICYLIAFLLPILILLSIGCNQFKSIISIDSWSKNTKQLIKPIINYENYQLQCLLANQSIIYDSSFTNDDSTKSYISIVSAGSNAETFSITVNIITNPVACTIATYNRIIINVKYIINLNQNNYQFTVMLPFSFSQTTSSSFSLSSVTQKGKIQVFSSGTLLDTTIMYADTRYNKVNEGFSIGENFVEMGSKNVSAYVNVLTENKGYSGSVGNGLIFSGLFEIESQLMITQTSLLNNIRTLVPFYIFLWLPLFFFVILPLLQWMFSTKLYFSKCEKPKIKID